MIEVVGKPILYHLMQKLMNSFSKTTKLIFIVGYLKEQIISYLDNNYNSYFDIEYVEQLPLGFKNNFPYYSGLGDAIGLAGKQCKDDDCFIFLSDRLPVEEYSPMIDKLHKNKLDGVINVRKVDEPQHYGVCVLDNQNNIEKIVEKPKKYISDYAVSGAYVFSKKITRKMFNYLKIQSNIPLKTGKEHQFTNIIQQLIEDGDKIGVNIMKEPIIDFGRISRFLNGSNILLQSNNTKTDSFSDNMKIIPPVYFGKNIKIENSTIGPNVSIGNDVVIKNCSISESVVGNSCSLISFNTNFSLLADNIKIRNRSENNVCVGDETNFDQKEDNLSKFIYKNN